MREVGDEDGWQTTYYAKMKLVDLVSRCQEPLFTKGGHNFMTREIGFLGLESWSTTNLRSGARMSVDVSEVLLRFHMQERAQVGMAVQQVGDPNYIPYA